MARRQLPLFLLLLMPAWVLLLVPRAAQAAPEAHILRIDPRTGLQNGKPVLTTVIEVIQFKRMSDVLQPCAGVAGSNTLACWSQQLETPGALWAPFPFPEQNAQLLVKVAGEDQPAKFIDKTPWGKAQNQPNVGTAWLVAVDAAASMGSRFGDARTIAHDFIEQMQPNDLMDLMFFDDVQVVKDTKWKTFKQRADLGNALNDFKSPTLSHGRDRALFSEIKSMTQDAFGSLGNSDQPDTVPLHQAMVLLSNGAGRGDPESASPNADVFHQYLDQGRFPPDNTSLPKTPLPVISIWLPNAASLTENIYRNNEATFMQALANPEIGGFFDIVQEGQGSAKAKTISGLVRTRFNAMWLVHWTTSCLNPSVEQTFNLVFENTHPAIAPDGTFKEVPLGMDPTQWPLDVDVPKTTQEAQTNPLFPGGQFTVYGDFCWSGDKQRAEAYFIPAGTRPIAGQANRRDPEAAKKAMQQLQAQHMLGTAVNSGDTYVTFIVPDDDKVLEGTGDNAVAHLVVYDNKAHRASAVDEKSVLSLKATKKPLSWPLLAGIGGLLVVIVLLVMVLLRSGGGRKRGGGSPPLPSPPGYGPSPGAYAGPRPGEGGGGYGMGMGGMADPLAATSPVGSQAAVAPPMFAMGAPPPAPSPAPMPVMSPHATGPALMQVRCPACGANTMAATGQPSVCFSCGQPIPASSGAHPATPAPNQYAPQAALAAGGATLRGAAGQYSIRAGAEVRVGRDPAQCTVFLAEPRVSGVHATLRFDGGRLLVRDETSNNGTWVAGSRLAPGAWTAVPAGSALRFGPVEFSVQLEA